MRLRTSNNLAKKLLNWKPVFTGRNGFKKALEITFHWYKKIN